MKQIDVERSQEFRKCIECFLCQNTCHVVRDHEENKPAFSGPRYFIRAAELDMHPLDDRTDRKDYSQQHQGLGYCNITKCCTEVCPEHIKITDNAIIPMKERVVDNRYDPLVWLGRKIFRRDQLENTPAHAGGGRGSGGSGGSGGDSMAPSNTEGVTGVASGLSNSGARLPEGPAVNADGRLDVAELLSHQAGGPSPFGDDQEFPLREDGITYRHPEQGKS
jgi:succinate dehydrogenase / fumarate reductase iron-sulfur subunit